MSNTRFLTTNKLATATVLNGTGGGAPAREETSPFLMELCQTSDRYTFWKTSSSTPFTVDIDFDLGSAQSCDSAFILGTRGADAASYVSSVVVKSAATYFPGAWTTRGTITAGLNVRDAGKAFASGSDRYWRFELTCIGQVSVGRLALGAITDLGAISSPGGEDSPRGTRIIQPMVGGAIASYDLSSDLGREITLPFRSVTGSFRTTLEAIATAGGSLILFDALDMAYECIVPDRALSVVRQFYNGSQHVYDLNLRLLRLP